MNLAHFLWSRSRLILVKNTPAIPVSKDSPNFRDSRQTGSDGAIIWTRRQLTHRTFLIKDMLAAFVTHYSWRLIYWHVVVLYNFAPIFFFHVKVFFFIIECDVGKFKCSIKIRSRNCKLVSEWAYFILFLSILTDARTHTHTQAHAHTHSHTQLVSFFLLFVS